MSRVAITLLARGSEPTEFAARIHAIRNCTTIILGLAWLIERHADPVARAQGIELTNASRWLKELVARYAKPCEMVREEFSVEDVLELVVQRVRSQAEGSAVQLLAESGGGSIFGDFVELAEALYNLASAAIQASPACGTVTIQTRRLPDGDHEWTVKDAGSVARGRDGACSIGARELRLSLARWVIDRHNGALRIESLAGVGTSVTMTLPGSAPRRAY
jgi:signal transduction histidine kinase